MKKTKKNEKLSLQRIINTKTRIVKIKNKFDDF